MSLVIKLYLTFFYAQHVSDINTPIIRSLGNFLLCGDAIEKSQVSDDGRINVRNMLSVKEVK